MNHIARREPLPPELTKRELMRSLRSGEERARAVALRALDAPANPEWLMGRIATLLSHFPQKDRDNRISEKQAEDWLQALRSFPQFAVEAACDGYLREETWRPAPAHIVRRCVVVMAEARGEAKRIQPQGELKAEPSADQRARVAAMVARFKGGRA